MPTYLSLEIHPYLFLDNHVAELIGLVSAPLKVLFLSLMQNLSWLHYTDFYLSSLLRTVWFQKDGDLVQRSVGSTSSR